MHLAEGVKISQQLISQALSDPNSTMGIEFEFFLVGAIPFLQQQMTKGLETMEDDEGYERFVKKLGDVTWGDVLHYFTPLGIDQYALEGVQEILNDRLIEAFIDSENVPADVGEIVSTHPEEAWASLKQEHGVHELLAVMRIFPEHRIIGIPEGQVKAIRDIAYGGNVEEIAPFRKLNGISIGLGEVDNLDDEINTFSEATRSALYGLVAKELTRMLGQKVVYTTDSNYVYHMSNKHEYWALTEDGSLDATEEENPNIMGMELVSSVMTAEDGMAALDKMLAIMNEGILGMTVVTTEKTGLHVNLGVKGEDIDPVKILVLSGDEHMVNKFDRATNANAASIQAEVQKRMAAAAQGKAASVLTPSELVRAASKILRGIKADPKDFERAVEVLNSLKPEGKAHSINFDKLRSGYVEYRAIGNKGYHKRVGDIRQSVLQMLGITRIATDPNAYRREFLKKLYLMVQRALERNLPPGEYIDVPMGDSVGMIGHQGGNPGGYGPRGLEQYRDTPYDGENFVQYGLDPGSDTQ